MAWTQPNILLIHSDQHRYDCVAAHGHRLIKTPHLDRLCREGTDFVHAFTPSPICSPARASLVTGQWPTQHGCMSIPRTEIYRPIDEPDGPLLPRLLVGAGYRAAHIGKWHCETPDGPPSWGVHNFVPEWAYDQWRADQGLPKRERANGWFGEIDPPITPDQHRVAWGAREAVRCIEAYHAEGKPFFVRWDPSEPHLPNLIPPALADKYPPETIPPWPSYPDTLEGKPWIQGQQRRTWGVDQWTWEDHWAPMVSRYLADITLLDQQVGRLLDTLDRLELAEDTIVIYTTDHGDLCGGHGMIDKHFMMYDDVLRVPLIVRWPGVADPGGVCESFVIHELDLATTLCAAAGLPVPESYEGHDLRPVLRGETPGRDMAFAQYQGSQFGLYSQRMARDRRWNYVWNATAEDELYDVIADPGELTNRAADPACADELARLRRRMIDWMASINDPLCNHFTRVQFEA